MTKRSEQTASPARNFTLTTAERVQAMVQGVPAWSRRLKHIEDLTAEIVQLHVAGKERDVQKRLAELTKLVETHNAYYPVEANLPFDKPWTPMPRPTLEAILAAQPEPLPPSLAWVDSGGALSVTFDGVTLRLDAEAFSFTRDGELVERLPVWRIEEFESAPLRVITTDTETIELAAPPRLDELIAAELSGRLRALRAASRAYRG